MKNNQRTCENCKYKNIYDEYNNCLISEECFACIGSNKRI